MTRILRSIPLVVIAFLIPKAFAAAKFVDLTAQDIRLDILYLTGLGFSKFGVGCDENGAYHPGEAAAISWQDQSGRSKPGQGAWGLKRYTIHFRIKDRKGNIIHEEEFRYSRVETTGQYPYRGKCFFTVQTTIALVEVPSF